MSVAARRSARGNGLTRTQHEHKEKVLTQPAQAKVRESTSAIVLKVDDLFLLADIGGDVPGGAAHGLGLFFEDCRVLDEYELFVNDVRPTVLSTSATRGYETRHDLTNPDLPGLPKDTIGIRRQRLVRSRAVPEIITIRNFGLQRAAFEIAIRFGSRFDDIFMLRGYVPARPGHRVLDPTPRGDRVELRSRGLDGAERVTVLAFTPRPRELSGSVALFDLDLDEDEQFVIAVSITPTIESAELERTRPAAHPDAHPHAARNAVGEASQWLEEQERSWLAQWCEVRSSNQLFDAVLLRGLRDLRMLQTSLRGLHYEAAGIPWFATLFGRDSAIVGLQMLAFGTSIARDTLRLLARYQAAHEDRFREAEPGKILHELRSGELARAKLVPQSPA